MLGAGSFNKLRTTLHSVFRRARKAGLWTRPNPFADIETRQVPKRAYLTLAADEVQGGESADYGARFGAELADLHLAAARQVGEAGTYGFPADNFIGRLPQKNAWHARWPDFFAEQRLRPQLETAQNPGPEADRR